MAGKAPEHQPSDVCVCGHTEHQHGDYQTRDGFWLTPCLAIGCECAAYVPEGVTLHHGHTVELPRGLQPWSAPPRVCACGHLHEQHIRAEFENPDGSVDVEPCGVAICGCRSFRPAVLS